MAIQENEAGLNPKDDAIEAHSRMKSVNVLLTEEMLEKIDLINPSSRSEAVRMIVSAILEAFDDGISGPLNSAINAARCTSARMRKRMLPSGVIWMKSIIWVPEELHDILNRISARSETVEDKIRVADLIRGSVIFISETDPYGNLKSDT